MRRLFTLLPCLVLGWGQAHAAPLTLLGITNPTSGDGCLPILGLANVGIRVSNLDKSRAYYRDVCGFEEAFDTKSEDGAVTGAWFKVNDQQFVELEPGLPPGAVAVMTHIAFRTEELAALRAKLVERGLNPSEIQTRPDGNLGVSLGGLPGQDLDHLEFVQYAPGSLSEETRGKFLGARRLSTHLEHAGVNVTKFKAAYEYYTVALGFRDRYMRLTPDCSKVVLDQLRMPGPKVEFLELFNHEGPATRSPKIRSALGPAHFAFTAPDEMAVFRELTSRGMRADRPPPHYAWDDRYNTNIFDPDGTRIEFMSVEDPAHPTPLVVYTPERVAGTRAK